MTIPTYRYFYCDNDSSNVIDIVVWLWHGYCCDIFQKKPGCPKAGAASNQSVCQRLNWNPSGQILYPSLGLPPRGICHISTSNSFLLLFVPPMLQNTRVPNVAWSKHIYIYIYTVGCFPIKGVCHQSILIGIYMRIMFGFLRWKYCWLYTNFISTRLPV